MKEYRLDEPADARDKAELVVHMWKMVEVEMAIPDEMMGNVLEDMGNQIKREFGVTWENPLKKRYLAEAHEFIDSYTMPLVLYEEYGQIIGREQVEENG